MIKKISLAIAVAVVVMLSSCNSKKEIVYFQNTTPGVSAPITQSSKIIARPGDKMSIVVNCSDPQTSALFSLITANKSASSTSRSMNGGDGKLSDFTVSASGDINFPILGTIHVAGLTREEIENKIRKELVSKDLVKDPVVVAQFSNLHYSITGEVSSPGEYMIENDRVTIIEAIAKAGDLTILGRRDNVKVIREENGQRTAYLVDLRNDAMFDSPVYYLQQNDVVYVEPNDSKIGQAHVNENNWKSVSLWLSLASFLTTISLLVFK